MIHINVQLLDRGEVAMSNKLETYRQEIVSLNDQILELLSRRGELAQKLVKKKSSKEHEYMIHNVKKK